MEGFVFDAQHLVCIAMFLAVCAALLCGFPVAFTLAGTALLFALGASAFGLLDFKLIGAYPQRIFAVMVNEVLIAVPLFVFMGVVLERAKIAEELLDNMGRLFGPMRGGLTVSVSVVGALLAASTGIVGATVITMGLLSLPTMLRRGYDPALACGSICAAGTLGQIIPPSIILVLLGDQLAVAYQNAQFKMGIFSPDTVSVPDLFAGGVFPGLVLVSLYIVYQITIGWLYPKTSPSIPDDSGGAPRPETAGFLRYAVIALVVACIAAAAFDLLAVWQNLAILLGGAVLIWALALNPARWLPAVIGVVFLLAGTVFVNDILGALFPGKVLSMTSPHVFLTGLIALGGVLYGVLSNPLRDPFWNRMMHALFAPIILIVAVLGSILGGLASPTEAASVGCLGAIWMAGYRLDEANGKWILRAGLAFITLLLITSFFDLRVGRTRVAWYEIVVSIFALLLFVVVIYGTILALARVYKVRIIHSVVRSTMEISVLVFVILIGASLFSLVFRGLGGEEMIDHILQSLPGGAIGALIVVMAVMFVMGFFLDFLEIMFIVVPIVAPVLLQMKMPDGQLMDPIWLGIMIAVNLQTSFLTPPFGFALFYLRGVAPESVTTLQIYKGIIPFVIMQVCILVVLWFAPGIVTWFPHTLYAK
jgi:TRAP-type mannitol/chloroaromatic compound transport system permease large subunit